MPLYLSLRIVVSILLLTAATAAQQASPVHVLKISAGPAGTESNGVFAFSEERSIFSRSNDREVIVFFQWENVAGHHKLVAQWRSPDGGTGVTSAIDYTATAPRFGAYWTLAITRVMQLGTWSVDVTMDGRPAGRFTFEITDINVEAPRSRRPLSHAELYERVNRQFVVLKRATETGRELDAAAGVLGTADTGRIYTDLGALDAIHTIRAVMVDGTAMELTQLLAWNRAQHWAVLEGRSSAREPLAVAAYDQIKIGSRCFSMEGTTAGARVIVEGSIIGKDATRPGEPTLIASWHNAFGMPGAPVIDEYGDIIGIIGGGMPQAIRTSAEMVPRSTPVIPFGAIRVSPGTSPSDITALRAAGVLTPPVVDAGHVVSGGFVRGTAKRDAQSSVEYVEDFSVNEKTIGVLITWSPLERLRGASVLRVFNAENKVVAESEPRKADFRKGAMIRSSWEMPMLKTPGPHRVDVRIGDKTYWRGHLRINP
jgi:hypothetical protein